MLRAPSQNFPRVSTFVAALIVTSLTACSDGSHNRPPADGISPPVIADVVLTDANIYTVNPDMPMASAVAIKDGVIVHVGGAASVEPFIGDDTQVADLDGGLVLPGFIDSHAHPMQSAGFLYALQLDPSMNLEEIQQAVRQYAQQNEERALLFGFGFGESQFGVDGPRKEMLDSVIANKPVVLIDEGGHTAWANSSALELFGIDENSPDPIPGKHFYQRDEDGTPTGWLVESQTFFPALAEFGAYDKGLALDDSNLIYFLFRSLGITTVLDAGMSAFEPMAMEVAAQLESEGRLPFRLVTSHMIQNPNQLPNAIERFRELESKYNRGRLKVGMIKIHNDGTIEARTAAMLEPYTDAPDLSGEVLLEPELLNPFVLEADRAGIDLQIHAIGDRTVREALDAIEAARISNPGAQTRHTLIHLEQVSDEDLSRFAEHDVIAQTTPVWHVAGGESILGPDRSKKYHRYRQLLDSGVRVTFGSDFPATGSSIFDMAPLRNIEVGHTRQPLGQPNSPILGDPSERLSLETMIRGYTLDAAYQLRMEEEVGSIEEGKQADLILLNKNIFEVPAHEIHLTEVVMTMLGGEIVHGDLPETTGNLTSQ